MAMEEEQTKKSFWKENWSTVVMALFLVIFAGTLLMGLWKPVMVHQTSMYPNLQEKDYLFIFKTGSYEPGDIVVFNSAAHGEENLIKRVVAVSGDTVKITEGKVYVNGEELDESAYLADDVYTDGEMELTLLPGEIFVLGDNRPVSIDCRSFGPIFVSDILGEAKIRFFHKLTLY